MNLENVLNAHVFLCSLVLMAVFSRVHSGFLLLKLDEALAGW